MNPPTTFIEDQAALTAACDRWLELDAIGLDTEFERTRTYYSRPALVQVFDGEGAFLVDPLRIRDFAPFARLLNEPSVIKVMHAAEGDEEVLELLSDAKPSPVFDTQMAAAFTGHGFSLGYRRLVDLLLGETIAKDETRSDWLRRPLSDAQVAYAAADVVHLLPMFRRLRGELAERGRQQWLEEETLRLQRRREVDRDPERAYLRIRQGRRMEGRPLATLRALAAWREREARERDLPRQMVVRDETLAALACRPPTDRAALAAEETLSDKAIRRYGEKILVVVEDAREAPPPPPADPGMDRRQGPWLKALKAVLQRRAEDLDMPAPLLAQTRTLEALVASVADGGDALPEELDGWRRQAVGDALLSEARRLAES